jgi:hypothetical protein
MDNLTFSIHQLLALLYQISGIKENGQLSLTVPMDGLCDLCFLFCVYLMQNRMSDNDTE